MRDNDRAQDVIAQVFAHWPADRPPVGSLSLYVRADKVALWQLWAESAYPQLGVRVRGVQHFSNSKAKNSADLAITADAVVDLVAGQANAVAVVSNDSDFGALFVKVRELAHAAGLEQTPFLWITSPDAGGLSARDGAFHSRRVPVGLVRPAGCAGSGSCPTGAQTVASGAARSAYRQRWHQQRSLSLMN